MHKCVLHITNRINMLFSEDFMAKYQNKLSSVFCLLSFHLFVHPIFILNFETLTLKIEPGNLDFQNQHT